MRMTEPGSISFIPEDQYWLNKLKNEFYFSSEEAMHLKERMQANYETVYRFCENDTFEDFDKIFKYATFSDYTAESEIIDEELIKIDKSRLINLLSIYINQRSFNTHINNNNSALTSHEKMLLERMNRTSFNYIYDEKTLNPRKLAISTVDNPIISCCLRGRYWFERSHLNLLYNLIQSIGSFEIKHLKKIFDNRNDIDELSSETKKVLNTRSVKDVIDDSEILQSLMPMFDNSIEGVSFIHYKALMHCVEFGVAVNHLRHQDWFNTEEHILALAFLLKKNHTISEAMTVLRSLERFQVEGLIHGLLPETVTKITNHHQLKALIQFAKNNLTIGHINKLSKCNNRFYIPLLEEILKQADIEQALEIINKIPEINSKEQIQVFNMMKLKMPFSQALIVMQQMNLWQAKCFLKNIDATESNGLNEVQAHALFILYDNSLRGEHLRGKRWFSCPYHKDVLAYLIRKMKFSIENALEVIKESSWLQIVKIMKNLSVLNLDNLNHFQIMALLKLDKFGLKKEHLEDCAWFNSIKHKDYLVYYMSEEKMSPTNALNLLRNKCTNNELMIMHENTTRQQSLAI